MEFNFKRLFKKWGMLFLCVPLILGLSEGDELELQGYFNARRSANFVKSANNIKYTLPPKTRLKVNELKVLPSGNIGMRVQIKNGTHAQKEAWIYYKKSNPGMKLFASEDGKGAELAGDEIAEARSGETTKKQTAHASEGDGSSDDPQVAAAQNEEAVELIQKASKKVQNVDQPGEDCDEPSSFKPLKSFDTAKLRPPRRSHNTLERSTVRCSTKEGYESCIYGAESVEGQFKIFKTPDGKFSLRRREWTFDYPGQATQDLGFYIEDYLSEDFDNSRRTYMMVFPRTTLPSVRIEGEKKVVTLSNGETVTYDNRSNSIIGGVIAEEKLGNGSVGAPIHYGGHGVLVRVDARGVNEPRQSQMATISKQGTTCKVPVKDLWPDQRGSSRLNFKFSTDSEFNTFLKARCGFQI